MFAKHDQAKMSTAYIAAAIITVIGRVEPSSVNAARCQWQLTRC